jgi:hypothetical protein
MNLQYDDTADVLYAYGGDTENLIPSASSPHGNILRRQWLP